MKNNKSILIKNRINYNLFLNVIVFSLFLWVSCGNPENEDSLKSKQDQLNEYKKELVELNKKIAELEKDIAGIQNGNEVLISVVLDTVKTGIFRNMADFQGIVEAENNVNLSAESGGTVTAILVKEGQRVSKGQLLASLDASILEAQHEEIVNALELATTTYQKQERLWKQNIGSEIQYLEAKNRKESLEKQLNSLRVRLSKFRLTAPFDGNIDKIFVHQGQMVSPGMPVIQVVDASEMKIVAEVPERYAGKFKKGDTVVVKYPGLKEESKEVINAIGSSINADNRTFNLYIRPNNHIKYLKANILAIISAVDYQTDDAIIIPTRVIKKDALGNAFVFVAVKEENTLKVKKKQVVVERYFAGQSVIKSGLETGELIIIKGYNNVDENDKIMSVSETEI